MTHAEEISIGQRIAFGENRARGLTEVLEYVADLVQVRRVLLGMVAPGGVLVVTVPFSTTCMERLMIIGALPSRV